MECNFDKAYLVLEPKETIWAEMRAEILRETAKLSGPEDSHFITYSSIEKADEREIHLIRANSSESTKMFESENVLEICAALLQVLKTIKACHAQKIILGELSRGLIHQAENGEIFLLDSRVWNLIKKSLAGRDFCSVKAPEVIAGRKWNEVSDVFAWGTVAYQLLTDRIPFDSTNSSLQSALILRGKIMAVKDLKPNVNAEISALIMAALNPDHDERIQLDELLARWSALVADKKCEDSDEEMRQYLPEAVKHTRKFAAAEKRFFWWWRNGRVCSATVIVLVIFTILFFMFRSEPRITKDHTSRDVINFYFESVRKTDPALMQETLYKVDNSLEEAVSAIHMLNSQLDVNMVVELEKMSVDLKGFTLETILETPQEAKYHAKYTLLAVGAQEQGQEYWQRDEILTLRPVRKVWRVVKIDVLSEKRSDLKKKE